eukprot:gene9575-12898_t
MRKAFIISLFTWILYSCCHALLPKASVKTASKADIHDIRSYKSNKSSQNNVNQLFFIRGGSTGSIDIRILKVLLQGSLTLFNVLCWYVPLNNKKFAENSKILSLTNAFSGGIFLMLSFGHLIPHSISSNALTTSNILSYVLVGFMAIFFIEKIAFSGGNTIDHSKTPVMNSTNNLLIKNPTSKIIDNKSNVIKFDKPVETSHSSTSSGAYVLCAAMAFHSFIEAASLGLAADKTSAILMAASIGLHQPAESLALLVAFLKTNIPTSKIIFLLSLYSMVSLIGVTVGVLISSIQSPTLESIIVAITAGTFIYVGTAEIIGEEFEDDIAWLDKVKRFVSYVLGLVTIYFITGISDKWEHSIS